MKLHQVINDFYRRLDGLSGNEDYSTESIRNEIASEASRLLPVLDEKSKQGTEIDSRLFSFVSFIGGYDLPDCETNGYLFSKEDLEREYNALGEIAALNGNETDCR